MRNNSKRGLVFTAIGVLACLSFISVASASVLGTISESSCNGSTAPGVTVTWNTITWLPPASGTTGCIVAGLRQQPYVWFRHVAGDKHRYGHHQGPDPYCRFSGP